ncbi:hypothetical protein TWF481_000182 [Arthrobotrys musiformis]|uniref:Uncharacterized protein n=1 Tax=Arthrobotrys musiformis TaxID=47236 RepID=A0AAV9WSK8_9PEZI
MQHILLITTSILLTFTRANARWLEAVSIRLGDFNSATNEWENELLDPVVWYDRIDEQESWRSDNRSFLTGRRGDVYDCSNNVVPAGGVLNTIGYYRGDVNRQLPERLNRLEIHSVQDCEDDDPLEIDLELEGGWGGGELGPEEDEEIPNPQNQNFWVRYNNLESTEPELDREGMAEEMRVILDQNNVIEEEEPTAPEDDDVQWISREDAGFKKLRKREPQAPPGEGSIPSEGGDQEPNPGQPAGPLYRAGWRSLDESEFASQEPNLNQNRVFPGDFEPLTPVSNSEGSQIGGNRPEPNAQAFRQLNFDGGFGGGGPGQADWDPMASSEGELDVTESYEFPQNGRYTGLRQGNLINVRLLDHEIPLEDIRVPVIRNLRIQDPQGLLGRGRGAPVRDAQEWLVNNVQDSHSYLREQIPAGRPDIEIFVARIWPRFELGPNTSFRFVSDPYAVHDVEI